MFDRCRHCGRELRDEISRRCGLGPECRKEYAFGIGSSAAPVKKAKAAKKPARHWEAERKEVLAQCWKCAAVQYLCGRIPEQLRCRECSGPLELLTINGVAVK